jgi:hypothetical protein
VYLPFDKTQQHDRKQSINETPAPVHHTLVVEHETESSETVSIEFDLKARNDVPMSESRRSKACSDDEEGC